MGQAGQEEPLWKGTELEFSMCSQDFRDVHVWGFACVCLCVCITSCVHIYTVPRLVCQGLADPVV